jgi:hypothetical protein
VLYSSCFKHVESVFVSSFQLAFFFADSCCCRASIYASLTGVRIPYLQLQAEGLLTGKFTLHAQTPVVDAGKVSKASRMLYPTSGGVKLADVTTAFSDVMPTFTNQFQFEMSAVTPGLPTDWAGVSITIPAGVPITLKVSIGLVAEISATRDNQFTASVGAFAKATSSIGLYVFSKIEKPCTDSSWLPNAKYTAICNDVLKEAGVTEAQIFASSSDYFTFTKKDGPTVKSGFSAPALTAKNNEKIEFGVGFYPMYTPLSFLV